jgi:hypothetical protein
VAEPIFRLARRSDRRNGENSRWLAAPGLPVLLAEKVPSWPTASYAGTQHLIGRMARENPSWGEKRIANELLLKLGLRVSPGTVRKYLPRLPAAPAGKPRGDQRCSTFLKNHAQAICLRLLRRRERDFQVVLCVGGHGTRFAPAYSP